jgi:thiosulfate reductase/polysulfide reductase chain A
MTTSRRKFIKISALGLGGLATTSSAFNMFGGNSYLNAAVKENVAKKFIQSATYCEVCFWKCAAWAHSDDQGNIKKIIGNDIDPHCNGRLCPRGTGGIGMYNDEDRLKTPLIRAVVDGEQTYREASWEEALDLVAEKFTEVKENYGAESFALLKHGSPGSHLEHLFKAYGSDTIAEPAYAQCRGPRELVLI